ncbi:hypothetical protein N0V93_003499 [Gnomoniopsis smithogilvyi]|uniref:Uncharacterized protein n=1 Tax=Gnomoniopsis smithogilvyi TaxID=1191159 RepID=A0A9W8Z0J4_9PEZI|nr:hypothetical protein N0V93_003499 [Gnomoniopsis smithogilvyi]
MATNSHTKKPSSGSVIDLASTSPSRIPRAASRASAPRTREPMSLAQALQHAADRHRVAQGSPSPAPRPSRQEPARPATSEHRPLVNMFPDKPIDLGRFGKRPRREAKLGSRDSFGSSSRNDGDTDDEFERKMRKFEADEKVFETLLKEERNGPFAQRKLGGPITRPASARGSADRARNGNYEEPRPTWGDTGYARQYTDYYRRFQDAPDEAAEHYQFLTGTGQGSQKKPYHQISAMSTEPHSTAPPVRPATTGPLNTGYSWQVDDDFTAGDMQGSTSPPVGFGRTNTRLDELKQLEIDAERQHPLSSKRSFLQRTNTKLDEIARLEKEAMLRYPVTNVEETETSPVDDVLNFKEPLESEGTRPWKGGPTTRLLSTSEDQRNGYTEAPDVPAGSNQHGSPKSKIVPQDNGINGREEEKLADKPVTVHNGDYRNESVKNHDHHETNDDAPARPQAQPSLAKDDPQDLLRRLARASSKSPSPRPAQSHVARKAQEEDIAEVATNSEDKVASEDKFLRAPKPTVGFSGISRSSSTNSISSKTSAMSGDPTARLAAEAKLFALDNYSERGSLRAPSPVPEIGTEVKANNEATSENDDETPRPKKFIDPVTAPTPVVPGAFIQTPAPTKIAQDAEEKVEASSSMFKPPEKAITQTRDLSTSPRASKSDIQRETGRQRLGHNTRRTKSASRHCSPVKNSAKPPTVKDDLRQIYQRNNIDDSELDDLTDVIMTTENPEEVVEILKTEVPNLEGDTKGLPIDEQLKKMNGMSEALKTGLAGIRNAKRGIERLETQVSRPGKPARNLVPNQPAFSMDTGMSAQQSNVYTYIQVPVPRLYRTEPRLRPTLFGLFVLLLACWQLYWAVEGIFYDQWGKQQFCYRGVPCRWDMDDPEYGYVIPVKLDEWITGGAIRPHAARWLEEARDGWADIEDWLTNTDIRQIHHQAIRDPVKKEQYWRRIEKKGLFPEWNPAPWVMPQIEIWDREAEAREEAEARAAMGYDIDDRDDPANDSMDKDQPISGGETVGWLR